MFKMADIIELMKQGVLDKAIRGELTEQYLEIESAHDLITQIEEMKLKLIEENLIRKAKTLPKVDEKEIPFQIPKNWEWVRLGNLGFFKKGPFGSSLTKSIFVPDSETSIKVYEQKNAIQKDWTLGDYYITEDYYNEKMKSNTVHPGDIIISCAGTIGESYLIPPNARIGIINQALMRVRPYKLVNEYFMLIFEYVIKTDAASGKGSAIKNIPPMKVLNNLLVPLPPLEEQKRIVKKIEEIFSIIDKIAERKEDALQTIQLIRQTTLQQAIQGKLVEQNEEDETVSELIDRIQTEKELLIKEKKIRNQKNSKSVTPEEKFFEIPNSWKWVRLGDIGDWGAGATPKRGNPLYWNNGTIPWLKTGELNDSFIWESEEFITEEAVKNSSVRMNQTGDILIAMYGATIGKTGILQIEATTNQACCACTPFSGVYNLYLFYYLRANKQRFIDSSEGGAQPNISRTKIVNFPFTLPPLSEQNRIVEKIEQIMDICDQMEELFK